MTENPLCPKKDDNTSNKKDECEFEVVTKVDAYHNIKKVMFPTEEQARQSSLMLMVTELAGNRRLQHEIDKLQMVVERLLEIGLLEENNIVKKYRE